MLDERLRALYNQIEELEAKEQWLALVDIYRKCIDISLEVYGVNHEETLALFVEYGGLLRNLGRYDASYPILDKALQICASLKGTSHPDYASAMVNMANLLRMMRRNEESEDLFLRAKGIFDEKGLSTCFQYAGLCNNLGLLYQQMGEYGKAIPLHRICLDILRGDEEHEVLYGVTLNNLVEPMKVINRRDLAIQYLEEAIAIFEKYIDTSLVLYASAMNNLGAIYFEDGNYVKARDLFKISMDISEEKLGKESESYRFSKMNYDYAASKCEQSSVAATSLPLSTHLSETACYLAQAALENDRSSHLTEKDLTVNSKGLEISEAYFWDVCYPMLERDFAEYLPRMAAGLVGEGSECFGFDDMISRDHDFGPSFQIFIPLEDAPIYGQKLRDAVNKLPKEYAGFGARQDCALAQGRTGVISYQTFYKKFLSTDKVPDTNQIWLQYDDVSLSTATNGKVFFDNYGAFSRIREGLLNHYPQDVCLKKMAFHCTQIAQSGQYNFPRSLQREQYVAASRALNEFIHHYSSLIYLMNKTYAPYYKWEHEGLKTLPLLGQQTWADLNMLVQSSIIKDGKYIIFTIEEMCKRVIKIFKDKGLSTCHDNFILEHVPHLMSHIKDEKIRTMNPWV